MFAAQKNAKGVAQHIKNYCISGKKAVPLQRI